ncbi:MAG TPA: M28 family peptidase [Bryobacteraceae bacterium]|nr:M28 family peptidase [Bryobacteraceae bacterium]
MKRFLLLAVAMCAFGADATLTPGMQAVINHITADSLRGNLSFLASDLLEGRATPSRGLDLAAEFIASQFRRAGLEPAGDDGYFQTATLNVREQNPEGFEFTVTGGGKTLPIDPASTSIVTEHALRIDNAPVVLVESDRNLTSEEVAGKIVVLNVRGRIEAPQGAALVLFIAREAPSGAQVSDPEAPRGFSRNAVASPELVALLKSAKEVHATIHVSPAIEHPAKVRNVAGLLRGSDPALKDTYVMVTAHYDHLGTRSAGEDKIYNGANDDGSGTVSVIEIASALATMNPHPKRSILFVAFFGEERGLLGSRYYGRHPIEPLDKTIADLNLEQVGRTDATNGPQIGTASITGFDFSDVPRILADAGKLTGVKVYKDPSASDPYFARSDNQALADVGIPAHTLCVAFDYPDYHAVGDEWPKVDYANMAKVDRTVALGLLHIASDAPPPQWNARNPSAKKYVDAANKLHP